MAINKLEHNYEGTFDEVFILESKIFKDSRGVFFESWNKKNANKYLSDSINFVQDNISISAKGVLRGIHYQLPNMQQGKLVRCIKGSLFDVVVDLRKSSTTFKYWGGVNLTSENNYQLWIPPGFGHGFLSLHDETILEYKVTNYWSEKNERTLFWNDTTINIKWPNIDVPFNLSTKDKAGYSFQELENENGLFI